MRHTLTDHDRLYDEYLDAVLSGRAEDPASFVARHGADSDDELLAHLHAVHDLVGRESTDELAGAPVDFGLPFERLGEFRVVRRLGSGGMGVVYLAEQESLGRPVALKVLRPEVAHSPTAQARFEREARAIARLRHPSIVSVHAVGEAEGVHYIAMELVPGRGLDAMIEDAAESGRRLEVIQVVRWGIEIAEALACAHEAGIVHRDVKPSNIRVTPDGRALLLDFGLARGLDAGGTVTQSFLGSPVYAAPEQIEGKSTVDETADVYGLGVVLYECLGGRLPFEGETIEGLMHRILTEDPAPLRSLDRRLPRDLDTVVATALEKAPERRYQSAEALASDLRAVLAFRPIVARRRGPAGRLAGWARRNRTAAIAGVVGLVSIVAAAGLMIGQSVIAERERIGRMRDALEVAEATVTGAHDRLRTTQQEEIAFRQLALRMEEAHLTDEERTRLDELAGRAVEHRLERERTFFEALEFINTAERLGADPARTQRLRARLYLTRFSEATTLGHDPVVGDLFLDLARRADPEGVAHELGNRELGTVTIRSEPPGARVYAFQMREHAALVPGGEPRQVPVLADGSMPSDPADWALRVVRGAGDLRAGDLIVRIGDRAVRSFPLGDDPDDVTARARVEGVRAGDDAIALRVITEDGPVDATAPPGLSVRLTAAPYPCVPAARISSTPIFDHELQSAQTVFVLRADGYEDLKVVVRDGPLNGRMLPAGTTPPGFVYVPIGDDPFWIMEHEVTFGAYLEFVNDPATRERIATARDEDGEVIRLPRKGGEPYFELDGDDRYVLPDGFTADMPVFAISWGDARAYAMWRTRLARAEGESATYALPTRDEWARAGCDMWGRQYVWGNEYRQQYASSCFALQRPYPVPVMSFPVDESPFGVFDMAGSVSEWLDEWWLEDRGQRTAAGGSWAHGEPEMFRTFGGQGYPADGVFDTVGFRLVMRRSKLERLGSIDRDGRVHLLAPAARAARAARSIRVDQLGRELRGADAT